MKQADKLQLPPWTDTVKTAHWKELSPYNPDWYYVRAASVARQIYLKQGLGVGKLRKIYGTCAHTFVLSATRVTNNLKLCTADTHSTQRVITVWGGRTRNTIAMTGDT